MGFRKQKNNINSSFKLDGLIFDSEKDYKDLKRVDDNILNIVNLVKKSSADLDNIFNNIKSINVIETYPDAYDEVDGLFINTTSLLIYEEIPDSIEYKVACKFFNKINVTHYEEEYN